MATKVERREQLLKKMAALPHEVRSAIKQALAQSADEIMDMQKRLVPVSARGSYGNPPGMLRDSIKQTWGGGSVRYSALNATAGDKGDPDLSVRISAGNTKVRYAHLVEFGTAPHEIRPGVQHPGAQAKPFFYPSYRALRKKVKSRITRATNKAAKRVAAGQ